MSAFYEKTRFDVEDEIIQIGNFSEMIKNYADMLYDGDWKQTEDDVHTTLHGFANMLIAHSEKMMLTHKQHYKLDEYGPRKSWDSFFEKMEQPENSEAIDEFYKAVEEGRNNGVAATTDRNSVFDEKM